MTTLKQPAPALPAAELPSAGGEPATVTAASLDELAALRDEWLQLYSRQPIVTPWSHPDRYVAELRVAAPGTAPHVTLLRGRAGQRGMIVGRTFDARLPCQVGYLTVQTPRVRLLHVVHGGLLTDGTAVVRQAIVDHLRQLLRRGGVDLVSINHLPLEHECWGDLLQAGAVAQQAEPHWLLRMEGSYDDVLGQFSAKQRNNIRRNDRRLAERLGGELSLRRFDAPESLEEFASGAAAIAARTYQGGLGCGFAPSPVWMSILRAEAAAGRTRCYWLECRNEPIAFQVGGVYEGIYFADFTGYLPQYADFSPGLVQLGRVLRDLCSAGVRGVDYGYGHAEYKQSFGTCSWQEATLSLYGRTWRARGTRLLQRGSAAASRAASGCLRKLGLHDWLKRRWRSRLVGRS